jgi:tetratricopeptide (TPR) repeat protein
VIILLLMGLFWLFEPQPGKDFAAARTAMLEGRDAEAERLYRRVLDQEANDQTVNTYRLATVDLGELCLKKGEYEEALSRFEKCKTLCSKSLTKPGGVLEMKIARVKWALGRKAEA